MTFITNQPLNVEAFRCILRPARKPPRKFMRRANGVLAAALK